MKTTKSSRLHNICYYCVKVPDAKFEEHAKIQAKFTDYAPFTWILIPQRAHDQILQFHYI